MPTISEVQDFLKRYQRTEGDPIEQKAKERVTREIATEVKKNKPLPQGRCNICGKEDDRLIPVPMSICPTCANKFIKRGGELRIIKKESKDCFCENCLVRTFTIFQVNPKVCIGCAMRIGRIHKSEKSEVKQQKQIIKKQKEKIGVYKL